MALKEIAIRHKTARIFRTDPVSYEDIRYILDIARQAPSGSNTQPWRFIIVTDSDEK